jgi:uncharacterized membrane protein (UPF0127 family)
MHTLALALYGESSPAQRYHPLIQVLGCSLLLLLLSAQTPLPRQQVWITRGDSAQEIARFTAEIADEPQEWQRGLMERPTLAPDAGMLFIFPEAAPRAFWMLNTLIPLDMIFVDATRRIINIQANVPPCLPPRQCPVYPSTAPARYVLEIAGGRAKALGIHAGDTVHF